MNGSHLLIYSSPCTSQFLLGILQETWGEGGENSGSTDLMGRLSHKAQLGASLCKKIFNFNFVEAKKPEGN